MTFDTDKFTGADTNKAVNFLLRQFKELQRPGQGGEGSGQIINNTYSIVPTVFVAASDAAEWIREAAFEMPGGFVCDGVDDHEEIQAAIDSIAVLANNLGGRVVLSGGQFSVATNRIDLAIYPLSENNWIHLMGMGPRNTQIISTDTSGSLVAVNVSSMVTDILFIGQGPTTNNTIGIGGTQNDFGIGVGGSLVVIERCMFQTLRFPIYLSGNHWMIKGNNFVSGNFYSIYDEHDQSWTQVTSNHIDSGYVHMGNGSNWQVSNNWLSASIVAGDAINASIVGNHFTDSVAVFNNAVIEVVQDVTGGSDLLIEANNIPDTGWTHIWVDGIDKVSILGNEGSETDGGIRLIDSNGFSIKVNTFHLSSQHMIWITNSFDGSVVGNTLRQPGELNAPNLNDGILIDGTSDRIFVTANKIEPSAVNTPRYGINVANNNDIIVAGNDLGDEANYGTSPINAGTGTRLYFPEDETYGSNFVGGAGGGSGSDGSTSSPDSRSDAFSAGGSVSVGTGKQRLPFTSAATIVSIRAMVDTAPTGADLIVDVNKNGTTVFTTQANRPTITAGLNDSGNAIPDVLAMAAGDYLTVDVDQVGSTVPGSDLTVIVEYDI